MTRTCCRRDLGGRVAANRRRRRALRAVVPRAGQATRAGSRWSRLRRVPERSRIPARSAGSARRDGGWTYLTRLISHVPAARPMMSTAIVVIGPRTSFNRACKFSYVLYRYHKQHVEPAPDLTIGAVAGKTNVSVATLRAWEQRHGFPRPERLPSGHRRFSARHVDQILQVLRDRDAGLSLEGAIARLRTAASRSEVSIFAGLRRRAPLSVHVLSQRTMLAISRAIEDECCAQADRPLLIGSFQRQRFYRQSERRWRELSRTAEATIVLADFAADSCDAGTIRSRSRWRRMRRCCASGRSCATRRTPRRASRASSVRRSTVPVRRVDSKRCGVPIPTSCAPRPNWACSSPVPRMVGIGATDSPTSPRNSSASTGRSGGDVASSDRIDEPHRRVSRRLIRRSEISNCVHPFE